MRTSRDKAGSGRRPRRGNALLEFILTLPIIIFMAGVTIYMSMAMLTRQQTLTDTRHTIMNSSNTDHGWSNMKLEPWYVAGHHHNSNLPRGVGEELDRLRADCYADTEGKCAGAHSRDFCDRLWANFPGRRDVHSSRSFKTEGRMWDFIEKTATDDRYADTSPWYFHDLDAWQIARSGPLQEVFQAFKNGLSSQVAAHFEPTRQDIVDRWWHYEPGRWPD